jgi:hypothetical protein
MVALRESVMRVLRLSIRLNSAALNTFLCERLDRGSGRYSTEERRQCGPRCRIDQSDVAARDEIARYGFLIAWVKQVGAKPLRESAAENIGRGESDDPEADRAR